MSFLNVLVLFSWSFYCHCVSLDITGGITETKANETGVAISKKKEVLTRSEVLDGSLIKAKSDIQSAGNLKDEPEEVSTKKIQNEDADLKNIIRKVYFFEKDLTGLLKESRGYLKNLDSSITQIVQDIKDRALKLVDNYIDLLPTIGKAIDILVRVLISLNILLALLIVLSVATLVWLVLVIYDKIESIILKCAERCSNTGPMTLQSTTDAGGDVEFTMMEEGL